eukprot:CAMPEP_0194065720 /NCGR_PEP_ID=MMETSP0009_2-20130614/85628_1 /TAXON_ID=210454 /ORGANISM="Grammatophora oceanica, Strain CCMP 410" /LENGTH=237 /DNA_ID=CAMNT_0038718599 /DNA_START=143 /DNA_END=856 /DNA_ORIENTATION=-
MALSTADLCDKYIESPARLKIAEPVFRDFGGVKGFSGPIETIRCFESNPMIRKTLGEAGEGRVLVVDGGGSKRVAIMGDMLAKMGVENGWNGIILNGCIRDSAIIAKLPIGVKALNTYPLKSAKTHPGERGEGRVLVVDGGGSKRVAWFLAVLAKMGVDNGWSGVIINGCIRDSAIIRTMPIGVKALSTYPLKSAKTHPGERSCTVAFAGVEFKPGDHVYADEDGILVSETEMTFDE